MDLKESNKEFTDIIHRHPWELARFEFVMSLIKPYLEVNKNQHKSVLDIGCGDLFFLSKLSSRLIQTTFIGVDPALDSSFLHKNNEELKKRNIHLYQELALVEMQEECKFVLLLDILEHIEEDSAFLTNLVNQPLISEKTIFIITVPAFQTLFCSHDRFLQHFRRYNNLSIMAVAEASGLEIISHGYFFFSLLIPRIITVFAEKSFKPKYSEDLKSQMNKWNNNKYLTTLMKMVLVLDFKIARGLRLLGLNIVGLSNFVICKKRVL